MSLRRSYLSRRIIHRSFTLSKSNKEIESNCCDNNNKKNDNIQQSEENDCESGISGQVGVVSSESGSWSGLLPEILGEIIERVESSEEKWPQRQNVVVFGCVCKRWREATTEAVEKAAVRQPGKITFPSSLKEPGPRDSLLQCIVRRDKKNGTFYLYLALTPSFTDKGKFLLAARKYRIGARTEYIISLDANELSPGSKAYVGKLRSDFLGTNFTIYDSRPPYIGAKPSSSSSSGRRVATKQISPQVPACNFEVGQVTYKFNLLKSRGPRRMVCSLSCSSSLTTSAHRYQDESKMKNPEASPLGCTVLNNKAPRWHEHLECWCLNFHGRVTVASVKNFQLVATLDPSRPGGKGDEETVLLQFGKVGDNLFTMEFRRPLSAFQAFAICLTSFGTKLACE